MTSPTNRQPIQPVTRYLTDRDLSIRYAVGRTTIWRWLAEGLIPRPVYLTSGTTRWLLADIENFESQRRAASAISTQGDTTTDPV